MNILLIGYYGRRNFGDDVLLKVSHDVLCQYAPDAEITVLVDGDGASYVREMLPGVRIVNSGIRDRFDLIVHGGGGVFFDFGRYNALRRFMDKLVRLAGPEIFSRLDYAARAALGHRRVSAARRIGLGIGVGTFAPGSRKLPQKLPVLTDFDALWIRDPDSVTNLARLGVDVPVILGTDLAFMFEHWASATARRNRAECPLRLGIALRDWPAETGDRFVHGLSPVLETLEKSFEITAFVLDEHGDPRTSEMFDAFPMHVWRPGERSIADYADALGAQDVLLTARAHGAICGACLGVPSVIVEIEPKLRTVHGMLPRSTALVSPGRPQDWGAAIARVAKTPRDSIAADVRANRELAEKALAMTLGEPISASGLVDAR